MQKKVAIVQSNYIPWKGYFDLINMADEFILLDDVQFTRRDWRNRNYIKSPAGLKMLSIPVKAKGNFYIPINKVEVAAPDWGENHWQQIRQFYSKAPFFNGYAATFESLYLQNKPDFLSRINYRFLKAICEILDINTPVTWSTDYDSAGQKTQKLLSLCQQAGATTYLSGPAAKVYLDEVLFQKEGIAVEWMDYGGYNEYPQLYPPFQHQVSVLDLLFNVGPDAKKYLKSYAS